MSGKKSANHKPSKSSPPAPPIARKLSLRDALIPVIATIVGVAMGIGWWQITQPTVTTKNVVPLEDSDERKSPAEDVEETPVESSAVSSAAPTFKTLIGKWVRNDGGYIINIKNVNDGGQIEAEYLNPRPIHVGKAEAKQDRDRLLAYVELQDVNYPGSSYTLQYEPDSDQLTGIYYQAVQQQRFEVVFNRLK